ncbi:MAG: hypothetical protein JNJ52_03820 [Flavobacterium sp.]|nr:hypothetical protein [Flavobacterium sp.]
MKNFNILFCLLLFSFASLLTAQTSNDSLPKEKKLKFGCGFGLNFVGGTSLSLAPNLTYKVSEKISFGAGIQGSYNKVKNLQNTTTFGANLLGFYTPISNLQTQLEFAQLRVNTTTEANAVEVKNSYWDSALFVGAGYTIAKKISIGAKYNFLYDEDKSVYSSPIIPFVNIVF